MVSQNLSELISIGLLSLLEKSLSKLIALHRAPKFLPRLAFLFDERILFLTSSSVVKVVVDMLAISLCAAASRLFDSCILLLKEDLS